MYAPRPGRGPADQPARAMMPRMSASGEHRGVGPIERETLHHGAKFDFERLSYRARSGKTLRREVVRHPGAVVVVPLLDDGRVVLIRNFRVAVEQWLWELPAGTLGKGEDPAACAGRQLIEETGYRAQRVTPLLTFRTTPGLTDELMHAFVATGLTHVGQALEEDEMIEVRPVPVAEALAMIGRAELVDAKSIVALLLADRAGLLGPGASGAAAR